MKNWWYLSLFVVLFVSCTVEKKEAFIVGDPGTSRTGYMLNK
jgi:hypothetical protein